MEDRRTMVKRGDNNLGNELKNIANLWVDLAATDSSSSQDTEED